MGSIGVLPWNRLDSCHGIDWSLVMGWIGVSSWDRIKSPKRSWTNNLASGWWRASGLLSWDRLDSCPGIASTLVMGPIGVLSWDRLESYHVINWSLVMGSI